MLHRLCVMAALVLLVGQAPAADGNLTESLKKETVTLKSAGPLAFGPQGILFIGDPQAAAIYAVDTGDRTAAETTDRPKVEGINDKIASMLGTEAKGIRINDLAVNPISGTTYLSVMRGQGANAAPVIVKVSRAGKLSEFALNDVRSSKAMIENAAAGRNRQEAITHLAYLNGRVVVAGLSNEEFASKLRHPLPVRQDRCRHQH